MIEKTHAELEAEHYRSVRTNPMYQYRGLMEVQMEEAMMAWPMLSPEQPEPEEFEYSQWRAVQQLRAEIQYVRNQLAGNRKSAPNRGNTLEIEPDEGDITGL